MTSLEKDVARVLGSGTNMDTDEWLRMAEAEFEKEKQWNGYLNDANNFSRDQASARVAVNATALAGELPEVIPAAPVRPVLDLVPETLVEIPQVDDEEWQERAVCAQTDPEIFFPEKGGSTREAKRVCMGCEVRDACLEYALANKEPFGIWGGLSERERRRLIRGLI